MQFNKRRFVRQTKKFVCLNNKDRSVGKIEILSVHQSQMICVNCRFVPDHDQLSFSIYNNEVRKTYFIHTYVGIFHLIQ